MVSTFVWGVKIYAPLLFKVSRQTNLDTINDQMMNGLCPILQLILVAFNPEIRLFFLFIF